VSFDPRIQLAEKKLSRIRHVLLVAGGKGGVGKSTVAASLALSIARLGYKTGLLDADIHGPSIPKIVKVDFPAKSSVNGIEPAKLENLKIMSTAFFIDEDKPIPVRGESKEKLVLDLFAETDWSELDFLVVDLPPGMGDETLAVLKIFEKHGKAILVTTPSLLSVYVVEKLVKMLMREKVPILGIVKNMAYIPYKGEKIKLYKKDVVEKLALKYGIDVLGELPLDFDVEEKIFEGKTPLDSEKFAEEFKKIVQKVLDKIRLSN